MKRLASLLAVAALALGAPARAATTCSGGNVALVFGPYEAFSLAPLDSQASLTVTCSRNGGAASTTITVGLGPSLTSGSVQNRSLARSGGAELLNYNLYSDAGRASVWGDTTGTDTVSQVLTVPNKSSASIGFTFFGRIFAGQDVPIGSYSDSVLITVTF